MSNSFGSLLKMTTWGESHGKGIGVVLDGFPSGIELSEVELHQALQRRSPGNSVDNLTSPRKEADQPCFLSGIFEGRSTGAPIAIWVQNNDHDSRPYNQIKNMLRPGHLSFTYSAKYTHWDYRGGGRASARETVARVAAGYCVGKWLFPYGVRVSGWISQVGSMSLSSDWENDDTIHDIMKKNQYHFFCPDEYFSCQVRDLLLEIVEKGDSLGGIVTCRIDGLPIGLGEPIYDKIEAKLASAMLSIPASKGFEIGKGFQAASMKGSEYTDGFYLNEGKIRPSSNRAGGTLAGISTGESIIFKVPFKPTSSIRIPLPTVDTSGNALLYQTPSSGRHDPCVALRAVPVVEAMTLLVLGDLFALSKSFKNI